MMGTAPFYKLLPFKLYCNMFLSLCMSCGLTTFRSVDADLFVYSVDWTRKLSHWRAPQQVILVHIVYKGVRTEGQDFLKMQPADRPCQAVGKSPPNFVIEWPKPRVPWWPEVNVSSMIHSLPCWRPTLFHCISAFSLLSNYFLWLLLAIK